MSFPIAVMEPGDVYAGRPLLLSVARTLALSGGPFGSPGWPERNLHTDVNAAKEAGLSQVVVSGTQWEGHMVGLLVQAAGLSWFDGGHLDVKLTKSVKVGETVQPKLRLDAVTHHEGHAYAGLTVWCENAHGESVLVGTAKCPIPAREEEPCMIAPQ